MFDETYTIPDRYESKLCLNVLEIIFFLNRNHFFFFLVNITAYNLHTDHTEGYDLQNTIRLGWHML